MKADSKRASEKAKVIIDGAMREFLERGYAAASMDRIAVTAGVSKPTIYNYFQNKEGLFAAIIEQLAIEKYEAILEGQDSQFFEGEIEVVLRKISANFLDNIISDREFIAFIRLIIGESGRFPELAKVFIRNENLPMIEKLSKYLASRKELTIKDPEAAARIIVGTLVYFVINQEMMSGKEVMPMDRDRLIDTLVDLFLAKIT